MNVFVIGGTGYLGYTASLELIKRGHFVKAISLPSEAEKLTIPKEMTVIYKDFNNLSQQELKTLMIGCDALLFAAGVDERFEAKPPIYETYRKHNINPIKKIFPLAKQIGIRKFVVLGSYFSYFSKKFEKLRLGKNHPYIKSRIEQEKVALSYIDKTTSVAVLQLPYIFGTLKGKDPVWTLLVDMIKNMRFFTYYPKGGSAMITLNQAGQFIADAVEKNIGGNAYPIGFYNLSWDEMLKIFHKYMNQENKRIIHPPKFFFKISMIKIKRKNKKKDIESGFKLQKLPDIMYNYFYIDKSDLSSIFEVDEDDIEKAIGRSVRYSLEILSGRQII